MARRKKEAELHVYKMFVDLLLMYLLEVSEPLTLTKVISQTHTAADSVSRFK